MHIPLVDLKAQYLAHKQEFDQTLSQSIANSQFIGGPDHKQFSHEFAEFCGGGYVSLCGNGTDALYLTIKSLLGPGDNQGEIITVSHTFIATAEAITMAGYKPVFVDIDPKTCLMDVSQIENKINSLTRCILPVHLYGQMVPMNRVMDIARKFNLVVIEDAAQAHGASYLNKKPGQWGHAAAFSFYPGKNLGAWGDGGAIFTQDKKLSEHITMLANHGRKSKYTHEYEGINSRLDGLQASVLRVKLRYLNKWNRKRRKVAEKYYSLLKNQDRIKFHKGGDNGEHVYHLFVIEVNNNQDRLVEKMRVKGVGVGIHYPVPLHIQPAYAYLEIPSNALPVTRQKAEHIVSLPIYPEISNEQVQYVVDTLIECIQTD
ncbi:Pleiotropic regulatory protein [Candidatus Magnetomoraceae bacterium gMMP-1]